jgi:hypothetical protein
VVNARRVSSRVVRVSVVNVRRVSGLLVRASVVNVRQVSSLVVKVSVVVSDSDLPYWMEVVKVQTAGLTETTVRDDL